MKIIHDQEREIERLNNLLRAVGWGQGEIDSAATIAEENERLREALKRIADGAYANQELAGDIARAALKAVEEGWS